MVELASEKGAIDEAGQAPGSLRATTPWRCATSARSPPRPCARPVHGTVDQGQGPVAHRMRDHGGEIAIPVRESCSRSFSRRAVQPCRAHPLDSPRMQGSWLPRAAATTWRVRRAARSRRGSDTLRLYGPVFVQTGRRRIPFRGHHLVGDAVLSGCIASPASRRALITTGSPHVSGILLHRPHGLPQRRIMAETFHIAPLRSFKQQVESCHPACPNDAHARRASGYPSPGGEGAAAGLSISASGSPPKAVLRRRMRMSPLERESVARGEGERYQESGSRAGNGP